MVNVYYIKNNKKWNPVLLNVFLSLLPKDIARKALQYKNWKDLQSYILGKWLVAHALNFPLSSLSFNYTKYGRPSLSVEKDFNISHSGNYVVAVVSERGRIGIDIEQKKKIHLSEFRRIFRDEEWRKITASPNHLAHTQFFKFWTQKEAILKAKGIGLSKSLFEVVICGTKGIVDNESWFLKEIKLSHSYICFLAYEFEPKSIVIKNLSHLFPEIPGKKPF